MVEEHAESFPMSAFRPDNHVVIVTGGAGIYGPRFTTALGAAAWTPPWGGDHE